MTDEQKQIYALLKANNKALSSEIRKIVREEMDFLVTALSRIIKQNQAPKENKITNENSFQKSFNIKDQLDSKFANYFDEEPENEPPIPVRRQIKEAQDIQDVSVNPESFIYHDEHGKVIDVSREKGAGETIKKVFKDYTKYL